MNLLWHILRGLLARKAMLAAKNLALRQHRAVLLHQQPRPRLCDRDRRFWVPLASWFSGWKNWPVLVRLETVGRWHRQGFCAFWPRKSAGRPGRPTIPRELVTLIKIRKGMRKGGCRLTFSLPIKTPDRSLGVLQGSLFSVANIVAQ
jgi:hypothetical protein